MLQRLNSFKFSDISDKQVEYRKELNDYIWVLAGPTIALLFFTLLHFPSKPSTPPSLSSQDERLSMLPGLVLMIKNKNFLLLLLAYSISQGVSGMYGAIMATNLKTFGVNGEYLRYNFKSFPPPLLLSLSLKVWVLLPPPTPLLGFKTNKSNTYLYFFILSFNSCIKWFDQIGLHLLRKLVGTPGMATK